MNDRSQVVHMDGLGRIAIPKEMREVLELKTFDRIEVELEEGRLICKKYQPTWRPDFTEIEEGLQKISNSLTTQEIRDWERSIQSLKELTEIVAARRG